MADVFTIDPNQSSLTASGSVSGTPFTQQGPGSLTTAYAGTIQATQTGGTIQFTGSSLITAQTNGSWSPLSGGSPGSAPADYGALVSSPFTINAAFRSLVYDVTSPVIPVTGGQFPPSGLTFVLPVGGTSVLDYYAFSPASQPLTGAATNNVANLATLTTAGGVQTLTIGVNAKFTFSILGGTTLVNVAGQIVATRNVTVPLVIKSPVVVPPVITLNWQAASGQFYKVLSSSNLVSWVTNASNITSATTNYTWSTTNHAPGGYYQLKQ